jgi:hypothetical protein
MELLSLDRVGLPTSESLAAYWASTRSPQIVPIKTSPSLYPPLIVVSKVYTVPGRPRTAWSVIFQVFQVSQSQSLPALYKQIL